MQVYRLKAVVEPDECGCHAWGPALKGCHTWGATVKEALEHLRDAARPVRGVAGRPRRAHPERREGASERCGEGSRHS